MHDLDYWIKKELLEICPHYEIYQLKDTEETRPWQFASLDKVKTIGGKIDKEKYKLIYAGTYMDIYDDSEVLDTLYLDFNNFRPCNYEGHSLSVSDIVVLQNGERKTAYYVDAYGFRKVQGFLNEEKSGAVEHEM